MIINIICLFETMNTFFVSLPEMEFFLSSFSYIYFFPIKMSISLKHLLKFFFLMSVVRCRRPIHEAKINKRTHIFSTNAYIVFCFFLRFITILVFNVVKHTICIVCRLQYSILGCIKIIYNISLIHKIAFRIA